MSGQKKKLGVWILAGVAIVIVAALVIAGLARKQPAKPTFAEMSGLSEAQISEAIAYGKNRQNDLLVDFEKPWTVFLGYLKEQNGTAVIYTPYYCLALLSRNAGKEQAAADVREFCSLAGKEIENVRFAVTLYGGEAGFDKDYTAAVIIDGQELPCLKKIARGFDQAREYTIISTTDFLFPPEVLKDKSRKITLQVRRPKLDPLDFVFDLKKIP